MTGIYRDAYDGAGAAAGLSCNAEADRAAAGEFGDGTEDGEA
ncbi:hypothetical protein [Streptomyces zhihengii]